MNAHWGQQEYGVNYWETFAPVVQWTTITFSRKLIHQTERKYHGFEKHVKGAYLQGIVRKHGAVRPSEPMSARVQKTGLQEWRQQVQAHCDNKNHTLTGQLKPHDF